MRDEIVRLLVTSLVVGFGLGLLVAASALWNSRVATGPTADPAPLRARALLLPVDGITVDELRDSFGDPRAGYRHQALDIAAPLGTRVVAVDDGRVQKLHSSVRGGLTVYQFDRSESYCFLYAHLDRYASGLREGDVLRRGALVGHVGTTGNAPRDVPHLHFSIMELTPERVWWRGVPVNPFLVWVSPG